MDSRQSIDRGVILRALDASEGGTGRFNGLGGTLGWMALAMASAASWGYTAWIIFK